MEKVLEDFLWYLQAERKMSPATLSAYKGDLQLWKECQLDWDSSKPILKEDITAALEAFDEHEFKASTSARKIAALRSVFRYRALFQPEWASLSDYLPSAKEDLPFPKALDVGEIKEFLEIEIDGLFGLKRKRALRNRALLELLYASGLRVTEAAELCWSHIDEDQGVLRIIGKGQKERFVPYSGRAFSWVEKYRDEVREDWAEGATLKFKDTVFLSHLSKGLTRMAIWKIVRQRSLECGIDDVHPHMLRHSFATHLLKGGADVRIVQMLLGHSSLNTTERYLKIDDSELKEIFATLHPLND